MPIPTQQKDSGQEIFIHGRFSKHCAKIRFKIYKTLKFKTSLMYASYEFHIFVIFSAHILLNKAERGKILMLTM